MEPRTRAPELTNFQAASISERESPTRWNNSVRTASEVNSGNRKLWKTSTQDLCQRSLLSSSARIAPVSISASAAMPPPETGANHAARRLGAAGIAALNYPQIFVRRAMEPDLLSGFSRG